MTQQVSHRPIKYQSRLWSQRGTKINRSHYGDNPLLRPTGIEIATKSYATLQAMAPTIIIKVQLPRVRNFLETSGSGTQYTIQGTGVKRVTSTAAERYWARDLASDYQYHGRQQEAPRIARTRLLYSAEASKRRDERPQDAWSHHRCCGRSGAAVMSSVTHNMLSLPISEGASTRGVAVSTRRITAKTLTSAALPIVLGISTGCLSRPSKNLQIYCVPSSRSTAPSRSPFPRTPLDEMTSCIHQY